MTKNPAFPLRKRIRRRALARVNVQNARVKIIDHHTSARDLRTRMKIIGIAKRSME
jgi:hypothetical protein